MALYVLSDLHLDESGESHLFRDERQGAALAPLCERVAREDAELVLLGDTFELTGMTPPARGSINFSASFTSKSDRDRAGQSQHSSARRHARIRARLMPSLGCPNAAA